jgi:pilus assembly protein CpaB
LGVKVPIRLRRNRPSDTLSTGPNIFRAKDMNPRILIVLTSALLISAGASYLVYRLAAGQKIAAPPRRAQIVVAAKDLAIGAIVGDSDLKLADWAGSAPKGSSVKKATAVNRGVVSTIYANEPVTESRLAVAGSGGGLAATIPTGMRACAVKVNDVVGVAGFVTPGMRVDVLITGVPPGADAETGPAVKTLLQNIQVLSAGANIEKDREGKPQQAQVVNLLVTPGQAEILSLAGNETRIQLVLRNPLDTGVTAPPGTVMSELFGQPRGPRPPVRISQPVGTPSPPAPSPAPRIEPPAVPSLRTVEVLNGPVRTQAKFESHGTIQ